MSLEQENVADYPRPPALEAVNLPLAIIFGGTTIAETTDGYRVLETYHPPTYYLPPDAFVKGTLVPTESRASFCEWKGRAAYFDVVANSRTAAAVAWCYPDPTPAFTAIADYVAVYAEPMSKCMVGSETVIPQPGNFYGGWTTPNITGPIKGVPGTSHW